MTVVVSWTIFCISEKACGCADSEHVDLGCASWQGWEFVRGKCRARTAKKFGSRGTLPNRWQNR